MKPRFTNPKYIWESVIAKMYFIFYLQKMTYLFTSESVSAGHPDKVADQISDAILDAYLAQDPNSKVACETLVTTNKVIIAWEVKSKGTVNAEQIARDVIRRIGYTKDEYCQLFSKMDFYEDDDFSKGLSKYTRLENLRSKIAGIVTVLMSFREFLSDECFDYLIDIMNSTFIKNGLYPYQKDGNNYYCNQDEVLACIFDLYEASRVITSQMRSYEIVDIHTTFDFKHFKRK